MSQAPTPPASRLSSEVDLKPADSEEASSALAQSLDTLLEQYLHLLDRQQHLQAGLSKHISSVWSLDFQRSSAQVLADPLD